jgi:hypothetical protein
MLDALPIEILYPIFISLDASDLISCRLVTRSLGVVCWSEFLWRARIRSRFTTHGRPLVFSLESTPALVRMEIELEKRERLADLIHERTESGLRSTATGGVHYVRSSAHLERIAYIPAHQATSEDEDGMGTEDGSTPQPFSKGDHLVFRSRDGLVHHAVVSSIPYVSGTETFVREATVAFQHRDKLRARTIEGWTASARPDPLPPIYKVVYGAGDGAFSFMRLCLLKTAKPSIPDNEWDDLDFAYYCSTSNLLKESQRVGARRAFERALTEADATGLSAEFHLG